LLLPEQIWDGPSVPDRELAFGRPSGSAMPLVWAHAEYLKLQRSLRDDRVYDMPRQTWQRYVVEKTTSRHAFWRFNHRRRTMAAGRILRLETIVPALVHWSVDGWQTTEDTVAFDTGLGEYVIDLPTDVLPADTRIDFTFYWPEAGRWEGVDFAVVIEG
jgi:glucoamylase